MAEEARASGAAGPADAWWSDAAFWDEMFDFIFPPAQLALGADVAARASRLLDLAPGSAVLDLGCGPGRVAVPLARMGHRVVGVDAQRGYLARARAWAAREGVTVELRHANVAELELPPVFDAVLSVFTSFGYFADPERDGAVLARARAALRRGGRLLLETAHRDGVVRLMHVRETEAPDGRRWREEPRFDPVTGVLEARWTLTSPAGTRSYLSRMRPYSATELDAMLRRAGFRGVTFHGDLDGGPPSLDTYTIVAIGET
ncbi:class I SAM-dependent methyltransferase [Anaeromyxobacter oryzae]|uniref:SAM-dependent methyltransferase n=1 Tax=Anaeromyxobacter oryzae TaxID=2918170 RepID=A0ABN6N0F5_9BACT|nr:class I SAM-dependent methyltransferase [Anaeromyxobacter oryzae]BDG05489.1 SAM-dependent methyltransferase [Anaeromyxobacter oryzae]